MLNEIQVALLPKGFHPAPPNRKRRRLAKKYKIDGRVQLIKDKNTELIKKVVHAKKF
jgi:hypothetical protein